MNRNKEVVLEEEKTIAMSNLRRFAQKINTTKRDDLSSYDEVKFLLMESIELQYELESVINIIKELEEQGE